MLFDTHAHVNSSRFKNDLDKVLQRYIDGGGAKLINCSSNYESCVSSVALTKKYDYIYAAVGIHPHDAKYYTIEFENHLRKWLEEDKVCAIGEIGLDYYRDNSPRDKQKEAFIDQLYIARELKKPIVIHNRDAHQDTYDILSEYLVKENGGVMHSYSGSIEMAQKFIELGLYLSISGPVTFKNAHKTVDVVRNIPLEHLLIETDCPYLTPEPYRGKRNEPLYVKYVAEKIAKIKNISYEEVVKTTYENAHKAFKI